MSESVAHTAFWRMAISRARDNNAVWLTELAARRLAETMRATGEFDPVAHAESILRGDP